MQQFNESVFRTLSIIGSLCLVICDTLRSTKTVFAGLPQLHDKMEEVQINIKYLKSH